MRWMILVLMLVVGGCSYDGDPCGIFDSGDCSVQLHCLRLSDRFITCRTDEADKCACWAQGGPTRTWRRAGASCDLDYLLEQADEVCGWDVSGINK